MTKIEGHRKVGDHFGCLPYCLIEKSVFCFIKDHNKGSISNICVHFSYNSSKQDIHECFKHSTKLVRYYITKGLSH